MAIQILVPLQTYPDGNTVRLASHATALAKHLDATLHALVLNADFPLIGNPLANYVVDANGLIEAAKARCRETGEGLLKEMKLAAERDGVALTCSKAEYYPAQLNELIVTEARYHDITVVGLNGTDLTLRASAEEALFGSGRPIVLIPEERGVQDYAHVAIAWDGSQVAARAVADASAILQKATRVTILCVSDEKRLPSSDIGEKLRAYLAKKQIVATVADVKAEGRPISEALQAHAIAVGAGLMVMGGYGHSRMRDFILGGATTGVLADLRLPILISH